jgi:hypothetical protein
MERIKKLSLVVLLLCAISCGSAPSVADKGDRLPPWNVDELYSWATDGLGFERTDVKDVALLAWNRVHNRDREESQNVLLWIRVQVSHPEQFNMSSKDLWILFSMSRYPQEENVWRENARVGRRELPGVKIMVAPPTTEQVIGFLGNQWEFESSEHFKLLDGGVLTETWRNIVGEPPVSRLTRDIPTSVSAKDQ